MLCIASTVLHNYNSITVIYDSVRITYSQYAKNICNNHAVFSSLINLENCYSAYIIFCKLLLFYKIWQLQFVSQIVLL